MLDDPVVVQSAAALFAVPTHTIPRRPGAQCQDQTTRNQGSVMDTTLHQEADKAQGFMVRFPLRKYVGCCAAWRVRPAGRIAPPRAQYVKGVRAVVEATFADHLLRVAVLVEEQASL